MITLTDEQAMEMATKEDIRELRSDVSKLTEMVGQLVRVEERQSFHDDRITANEIALTNEIKDRARTEGEIKTEMAKIRGDLDKWVNRGLGFWAAAVLVFAILNAPSFIAALKGLPSK